MEALCVNLETAKKLPTMPSYYVFPDGRIYSTTTRMFLKHILSGKAGRVYLAVRLQENNVKKTVYVHRAVAEAFLPNPTNLPQVNHKDGNKLNPDLANLEWVSSGDNRRHAYATGLHSQTGERNGNAKRSITDIDKIRAYKGVFSAKEVGQMFGTSNDYITSIWRGERWPT